MITPQDWEKGLSYPTYKKMIQSLVAEGKTTGTKQTPALLEYTNLNIHRMNRWEKTATILPELAEKLKNLPPQNWLILTEGWCGDAAQNIPIFVKFTEIAPQINLRLLLRDEHLDIIDMYLTAGGRSIPKLIAFEKPTTEASEWKEFFNWGPRPAPAQELLIELKKTETPFNVLTEKLHKWYADDKNAHVQAEILKLL